MTLVLFSVFLVLINLAVIGGIPPPATQDLSRYFPRIVGGDEADIGAAPHMAALVITEVVTVLVCGASIVSRRHLMTAAHCIDEFLDDHFELLPSYHGVIGTNDWYRNGTHVRISNFYIHPRWDPKLIKNDIAILCLRKPLAFGYNVQVVALNYNWVGGGENTFITGWGQLQTGGITPFKLQILFVRTLSPEECARRLAQAPGWGSPFRLDSNVEICTFHSSERGLCHNDSGSPLVLVRKQQQVGIASWAFPCARGFPDVYTRLSGMEDFLRPILQDSKDLT